MCRTFYKAVGLLSVIAWQVSAVAAAPNILVLLADDMAPYDVGGYGNDVLDTPNLTALANSGAVFTNAYNMGSYIAGVCNASRRSIMTGRSLWNAPTKKDTTEEEFYDDFTIPVAFNNAGYNTFVTSKNGNTYQLANDRFSFQGYRGSDRGETGPKAYADSTISFMDGRIAAADTDPYLAYVAFANPHDPRNAPAVELAKYGATTSGSPPYPVNPVAPPLPGNYLPYHPFDNFGLRGRDEDKVEGILHHRDEGTVRNELGKQYAVIDYMDQQIGRILSKAEAMEDHQAGGDDGDSVLTNTVILFTSDHGMAVGSHGLQGKQNIYEHTVGVPMVVAGAIGGQSIGHQTNEANIYLHDIFPTMAELAAIATSDPALDHVDGQSFAPAVLGQSFEGYDQTYHAYTKGKGATAKGQRAIRIEDDQGNQWKLIHYNNINRTQLFNVADHSNPLELYDQDLAHDVAHYHKLMELKGALLQSMSDLNDPGALGYVGINVAFGKTTAQSSNPAIADAAVNGAGAIQGLVADDADALPPEYTLTGTETNPWWEVDLGEDFNIDQLILYNGEVAQDLRVDIFDADRNSIYNSSHNVGANKEWQLAPSVIQTGQYVRVTHETASGVLSLEEVQVFAVPDDVLGDFNDDGSVDGTDFLAWQRGESPDPLSVSDLADWEANYGMDVSTVAAAAATVPEPSTVLNLLVASITLIFHRGVIV